MGNYDRNYYIEDENGKQIKVPGVTTICQLAGYGATGLQYWACKQGYEMAQRGDEFEYRKIYEKACTVGSIVHSMIEADLKEQPFDLNELELDQTWKDQIRQSFENWSEWKRNSRFRLVHSEMKVISTKYRYGGRFDVCMTGDDGELHLFDWKTGDKPYAANVMQAAAYVVAYHEMFPDQPRIKGAHLLFLGKESGTFTHKRYKNLTAPWKAFLAARQLYDLRKPIEALCK